MTTPHEALMLAILTFQRDTRPDPLPEPLREMLRYLDRCIAAQKG